MKLAAWRPALLLASFAFLTPAHAGGDAIFANSFENGPDCVATPAAAGCPAFDIVVPGITIQAGESARSCYYFRSANSANIGLERIASTTTGGVASITLLATYSTATNLPAEEQAPGTVSQNCGIGSNGGIRSRLVYRTPRSADQINMPPDDGTGVPVAIPLAPNQPLVVLLELLNPTANPIVASGSVVGSALTDSSAFTPTAAYHLVNTSINLPPSSTTTDSDQCTTPTGAKFWYFTTRTFRLGTEARAFNFPLLSPIVITSDWESPNVAQFTPPFYSFLAGEKLGYSCTWNNTTGQTVNFGNDPSTDETCEVVAYYFPATEGQLCVNNVGPL